MANDRELENQFKENLSNTKGAISDEDYQEFIMDGSSREKDRVMQLQLDAEAEQHALEPEVNTLTGVQDTGQRYDRIGTENASLEDFDKALERKKIIDYSDQQKARFKAEQLAKREQMIGNKMYPSEETMSIRGSDYVAPESRSLGDVGDVALDVLGNVVGGLDSSGEYLHGKVMDGFGSIEDALDWYETKKPEWGSDDTSSDRVDRETTILDDIKKSSGRRRANPDKTKEEEDESFWAKVLGLIK
jgi:hypothetical protein